MFIRSERLFLRPVWAEDAEELQAQLGHRSVISNLTRVPWPYTLADAAAFARAGGSGPAPRFLITLPDTGGGNGSRIIGGCGLSHADGDVNLGYWITPSEQGRGYATEAARAVLDLARTLGHRRIVAHHFVDNGASGRVLKKVGFRKTGRVTERFSPGRGHSSPSREHEITLGVVEDCDSPMRQRAA